MQPCFFTLVKMLKFSSPLVLSSLGVVLGSFIDRLMIKDMLSFSDLGEYSLAARVAGIVSLLSFGFQSALAPLVYSQLQNPSIVGNLRTLLRFFIILGVAILLLLSVIAEPLISVIAGTGYAAAPDILLILSAAIFFLSCSLFFPGLLIAKKTYVIASINIFSGLLNLLLNFILIPDFGIHGAGFATLISACVSLALNIIYSEKYYPILSGRIPALN